MRQYAACQGRLKVPSRRVGGAWLRWPWPAGLAHSHAPKPDAAVVQADFSNLISFHKAIPDGRSRRGASYLQLLFLLVAVLGILSGCRSSSDSDLEGASKRHLEPLGQDFKCWLSAPTFLYLFSRAHLHDFFQVLQAWLIIQIPGGTHGLDQLVCCSSTLIGTDVETEVDQHTFVV
ncbi:hypothetical protein C7K55_12915 [Cyanobium usitatum str. Tous]|uniref:H repeat-associated protein N-terminal domain-containing protein n=1 Tax=Cyanobium usitatum str. Tous TaxID=2116684 RepID=A0A2P7MQK2_9CYAN|nr:hypothetical protein C7K55_12915 [Cyanobium usitatum str. Tous]